MIYDIFPFKDFNPSLIPRLQENFKRIQHAFNHLQSRYFQREPIWDAKQDAIYQGPTPPENPTEGTFWLDTSRQPNVLYRYEGGQWVKVTPTEPEEIGAEPRIARGSTPPSNPKADDIWIDTSTTPPVWKRWTGSAWEKMTRTHFAELFGQIVGTQIADEAIEPHHIAWLDATLITAGTMLFDRVRGGTAELGGAGNGDGVLIVRDASGVERARVDNQGVQVFDANFLLKDAITQVPSVIGHTVNLVNDHSFELIPRTGSADRYQTFAVDTGKTNQQSIFFWRPTGSPRILSTRDTGLPQLARFDLQAAVIRHYNQVLWRQYCRLDWTVRLTGPYTVSAWFAAFEATTANTTAKIELWAVDSNLTRLRLLATAQVSINASEKYVWKRAWATAQNLPANTEYLEITIFCDPDTWVLCDGVQLVPLPYPATYDPESNVWPIAWALDSLAGYVPRSIRITRTSNRSVPNSTPTAIPWQARYPGYSSSGMWEPSQPDTSQIFIPRSGKYLIICTVRWAANGSGYRMLAIKVNDGNNIAKVQAPAVGGNPTYQQISAMAHLNAGDYIQIIAVQNSGTTLNLEIEAETAPVLSVIEMA